MMSKESITSSRRTTCRRINRRQFLAGAGAAAVSFTIVQPQAVHGAEAGAKLRLGLIGCGGRGTWIGDLFKQHGGYELTAAADFFQDKVDAFGDKLGVDASRRFSGLSSYKRLLESGIDAIAIETPPYFHPEHAAAAVDAGIHVYLAKPIAVDVWGCKSIQQSGKKASDKKLCFLVDFQTRVNELFCEAVKRVHNGAIGDFAFGEATYHAETLFKDKYKFWQGEQTSPERRLRAWQLDKTLSGDMITEQSIHALDVASWIMNTEPIQATGTGGRKVRTQAGDIYDCFTLVYEYPNRVGITFSSRQFDGYGTPEGIRNRMFGSKGVLETEYGGQVLIRGENFYRGGKTTDIYKQGAVSNIAAFYTNITGGNCENSTVEPSFRSNLLTILGRTAAYEGRTVKWDELLKSDQKLEANLTGVKD